MTRLLVFNATVGTTSVLGNVFFMSMLVGWAHAPLALANVLAMSACSVLNFYINDRVVFRS